MCIFNTETEVSATRIFVAPLAGNRRQLTIYSNQAHAANTSDPNNAMILPIPSARRGDDVKLHDFSSLPGLFDTLESCFPIELSLSTNFSWDNSTLDVVSVGDYQCSVVPSVEEFDRLQSGTFNVTRQIRELLQHHYRQDYCFLVCRFREGGSFHPIAYSHAMPTGGHVFIPTRHDHGDITTMLPQLPHWDHDIYMCNVTTDEHSTINASATRTLDHFFSSWPVQVPRPKGRHMLQKMTIKGSYPNRDLAGQAHATADHLQLFHAGREITTT